MAAGSAGLAGLHSTADETGREAEELVFAAGARYVFLCY